MLRLVLFSLTGVVRKLLLLMPHLREEHIKAAWEAGHHRRRASRLTGDSWSC